MIPLVDLALAHHRLREQILEATTRVMDSTGFVGGPEVAAFEAELAAFCGVGHAVGVGNGTDALELALRAGGVGPGDEVIVPANTFVATAEAVLRAGATLVVADCDERYLLDPVAVAAARTARTRAVVGVHLYGQAAPMEELADAVGPDVLMVEDAAQAQGARRHGIPVGGLGHVAGTSFYPGKNLGAYGDAGAVLTDDADLADRVRMLGNHGGVRKYEHLLVGTNSRLDALQAAVLRVKLAVLEDWNAERRAAADRYHDLLGPLERVRVPGVAPGNESVWHLYVVRVPHRDRVLAALHEAGIGAGVHYPAPVHRLPAFLGLNLGRHPRAEAHAAELLSLPLYPGITQAQQERVVDTLARALR